MTITTLTPGPMTGEAVGLTLDDIAAGYVVRWTLDTKPSASALTLGPVLALGGALAETVIGATAAAVTPDVPGLYQFTATVYRRTFVPPQYGAPPRTAQEVASARRARAAGLRMPERTTVVSPGYNDDRLLSQEQGTIAIGSPSTLRISAVGHALDLRIVVHDGTVTSAALLNPSTELARLAALDAAALAAVAALVGLAVTALGEDIPARVLELQVAYAAHRADGTIGGAFDVHYTADAINVAVETPPAALRSGVTSLHELRRVLALHLVTPGTWHRTIDLVNCPLATIGDDVGSATVMIADLIRVYLAHIGQGAMIHKNVDIVHTITAPKPLSAAIGAVLTFLGAEAPATPAGENPGHMRSVAALGFKS